MQYFGNLLNNISVIANSFIENVQDEFGNTIYNDVLLNMINTLNTLLEFEETEFASFNIEYENIINEIRMLEPIC